MVKRGYPESLIIRNQRTLAKRCKPTLPKFYRWIVSGGIRNITIPEAGVQLTWEMSADPAVPGPNRYSIRVVADNAEEKLVNRVINVPETRQPTITLEGDENLTVECGQTFEAADPGATALDINDQPLTVVVHLLALYSQSEVDLATPLQPGMGPLRATYTAVDAYGRAIFVNHAPLQVMRFVTVTDTTSSNYAAGRCRSLFLVAFPHGTGGNRRYRDGDLTDAIVLTGTINLGVPGIYNVSYNVTDNAGNGTEAILTVTVADDDAPVITLNGDTAVTVECGGGYVDAGATAFDLCSGDHRYCGHQSSRPDGCGTYTVIYNG